ncbi:MAG: rhodanese-like domain-containing protein [Bacteroidetes bacterium]|jgi:rhodanese-related sulfurtransferase|nr:rhodanese-like domain-containing protein [Bacteroidota bacterium]MDA1019509.1 rhodanese-like domain-containing protein [Bacteroidota bacterium]|tara:strand:- start:3125 stop:3508 length:384 start_codon:yes stop_codon:yes gene_type:complete
MYKLIILLIFPLVCFSQISKQNKYEILDYDTFKKNVELENILLVDVRTFEEYNDGHINGAINIDFYQENIFNSYFKSIDKNKPLYVYCRSGNRSRKTSDKLIELGFFKIFDLKDGYVNWVNNQEKEN